MTRRRYRYDPELKEVVEIPSDWTDAERRAQTPTEGITYSNLRATDGTPIDSKRKHAEYMKANGLALASDYSGQWAKASQQREAFFAGKHQHAGLKQAISRAIDTVRSRKR